MACFLSSWDNNESPPRVTHIPAIEAHCSSGRSRAVRAGPEPSFLLGRDREPAPTAARTPSWANMDAISQSPVDVLLPKHILDIWAIVLIILATVVIMTSLFLCPATAVIIYRMRTHPVLNGAV